MELETGNSWAGGNYWGAKTGPGPRVMAADTLEGEDVMNAAGEDLGSIDHIMIDVPTGKVAYAVLSFGGFMGVGDKLFAVPWRALKLDTQKKCFILNASKEYLSNAPGFDKDDWPTFADEEWARHIHSYYQSLPYWE
jgi:sporulation protein YlmC with PRC-barrel domain